MIRKARPEDFPAVWTLAIALHAEHGLFAVAPEKAMTALVAAVDEGRCFVATAGGRIIGHALYRLFEDWYSDETVMSDMGFYVTPAHRRSRAAIGLRNAMKREAKDRGVRFFPGCVGRTQDGARLFTHGFKQVGIIFEAK